MFRITKKADYAVFILSYLARRTAEAGEGTLVSAQELASFSNLNKSLIANLLKDLTRAGFLSSVRGARGGYRLERDPEDIALLDILHTVEGPFTFVECASHEAANPETETSETAAAETDGAALVSLPADDADCCCSLSALCVSKGPLQVLHARITRLLRELTVAELSGLRPSDASEIAQELFPSRAAAGTRPPESEPSATVTESAR